jgi:CubicO group peptidase (beta-lactamase class C family)
VIRRAVVALTLSLLTASPAVAQEWSPAEYMALVEGAQAESGPNGLGDLTLEELLERFDVPGVGVAVIHDFQIHWEKGYGVADVETGAAVDTETLFQAASISKPVTAMGVLRAVQDGLFSLDDDINDVLTSWTLDGGEFTRERPVTPRSLMSHTSGLGDGFGFPGYDPSEPLPTLVQIFEGHEISNVRPLFMERSPMSLMEYSGGGVTLLQQALVDARGRPFPDIMRDDVLVPVGMGHSTFEQPLPRALDRNAARGHGPDGQSRGPKWHVYPEMAAAGLWTTAGDLARFALEVQRSAHGMSNRVLSRTTVLEMLTPVGVGSFSMGFQMERRGEGWYFSHTGGNWGFQCALVAHKLHGYGLAIMTNGGQSGAVMAEISRRIQEAYDWDSVAEPAPRGYDPPVQRTAIEIPEEVLSEYVGEYVLNPDVSVTITLEDGTLYAQPTGAQRLPIFPEAADRFFLRSPDAQLRFERDASGDVTGMVLMQGGREQAAPRVE